MTTATSRATLAPRRVLRHGMRRAQLPLWAEDDDVERFASMTVAARIELCLQLCDVTDSVVNARPDRDRLRAGEPLSAESEALLARLRREARVRS